MNSDAPAPQKGSLRSLAKALVALASEEVTKSGGMHKPRFTNISMKGKNTPCEQ